MAGLPTAELQASPADTRQRLLDAAGQVFAQHGFHQATVRQITEQAGVNLAAVNYHFRDKAELYAAVMRDCFCLSGTRPEIDPALPAPERLRAWIFRFVEEKMGRAGPSWRHQLMAREMQEPTPALGAMVEERICPDARDLATIIRSICGPDLTEYQIYLLGFSIVGQAIFHLSHAAMVVRIYPPFSENPPDAATLSEHIHQFSLAALTSFPHPAPTRKSKK